MKKSLILSCMVILSIILIRCSQYSTDKNYWPGFRGINCSGIAASEQDPPVLFNPEKNVLWTVALPDGYSSPSIWGKNIFITGVDTENKLLKMFCINRANGKIKWVRDIEVEEFEKATGLNSPASATPATDGESVYFYFSSYGLLCYNFHGDLQWELKIPLATSRHGMGTSPIVSGDLVILNFLGQWNDPRIIAVNKNDGNIRWKYSAPKTDNYNPDSYDIWGNTDSYATPIIYNDQVIINTNNEIAGYSSKTGEQIWSFFNGCPDAVVTPVIGKDLLYVNGQSTIGNPYMLAQFPELDTLLVKRDKNKDSMLDKKEMEDFTFQQYPEKPEVSMTIKFNNYFWLWDHNRDEFIDETEWKMTKAFSDSQYKTQGIKAIKLGGTGNVSLINLVWNNAEQATHVSSPLYYKNRVYIIRDGGIASCFNAENGELIYKERLGAAGAYFSSPIVANDRIYVASRKGVVTVFEAGDSLKILAQNDLKEDINATPAIIGNKLYLRTYGHLYAFEE
jgi:outer membrane protein assembly factor BamB